MDELNSILRPLRDQIDVIDAQIISLLNQRATIALKVGKVKKKFNAQVFRLDRELQVIKRLKHMNTGPLSDEHIGAIWRDIMSANRALEQMIHVAFLGPIGTYTEQAMFKYFGQSIDGLACQSLDEIFRSVEVGLATYGVVPIENSTEGTISRTLDLLLQTKLLIVGEIILPIHHNLLTQTGSLDGVTQVCAHAQTLIQCQKWLSANVPFLKQRIVSSNAEGARLAASDSTIAGIAGERAATYYELLIASVLIQDNPHNRTRFVVLGKEPVGKSGHDQTSLIVFLKNEPLSVFKLLQPLERYNISIVRLESRPAQTSKWEYYFYIDIEGHQEDSKITDFLVDIRQETAILKVVGSYPRACSC
ncbi:MAG: prephenate dehydratase [Burkholderia sp.]|nr:prephenate dehydratase [Burkholderia sp.]